MEQVNAWAWWQAALAGNFGPIHDSDPQQGFYRVRDGKDGPFLPVAIWNDGERWIALRNGKETDAAAIWTWVCRNPITEDAYEAALETGKWADVAEGIGHNSGELDPFESLDDQIKAAKANVETFSKIDSDEMQAKAQSARARLNELSNEAEKIRKREKEPHFEAGKAVDAKWQPLVKGAKDGADAIGKSMSAYETEKARRIAEERRKAEAEQRRIEEENRKLTEAGKPAIEPEPVRQPDPEPASTTIKGGYGRAASVRVIKVATVIDQDKAYHAMKTHPELCNLIAKLAQRAVDKGHEIDGVTVEEQRKVA